MLLEGRSKVCKSFSDECGNNHEHDDIIPVKIKYSDDAIDLLPWCEKIQDSRFKNQCLSCTLFQSAAEKSLGMVTEIFDRHTN